MVKGFQGELNPGKCAVKGCVNDRAQGMRMPSSYGNFLDCSWPCYAVCKDHLFVAVDFFLETTRGDE
jgi:hypothetical protein